MLKDENLVIHLRLAHKPVRKSEEKICVAYSASQCFQTNKLGY